MLFATLLALQAGPPATPPRTSAGRDCPDAPGGEVVVCGRRDQEEFRLRPLPDRYEEPGVVPRAAVKLGPGQLAAETEQVDIGGVPSKRLMLRFKLPF